MSFQLSEKSKKKIDGILAKYPQKRAATLPILHLIQSEHGYLSQEAEQFVAGIVDVPPVKVREVIKFYTMFYEQNPGKHHFQVCRSLSCWLRGAPEIVQMLEERLHVKSGETSEDGKFAITEVECLGACEIAPMLQLNDDYIGLLTRESLDELIESLDT